MSSLRELPKKRNAVQPSSMRWLKHIYDVYNELDPSLLQRPDVIEAYNQLYDKMDTYKYAFVMEYPQKNIHHVYGIVPIRYTTHQIYTLLHSMGESYTEDDIKHFHDEYQASIPYYLRRRTYVYLNGHIRLAGMPHDVLDHGEIKRLLDVTTLNGTPYDTDLFQVASELTSLYIALFDKVKEVIEPAIFTKWALACQQVHVICLQKAIEKKNAERIRFEKRYMDALKGIEKSLDHMYMELDKWTKKRR